MGCPVRGGKSVQHRVFRSEMATRESVNGSKKSQLAQTLPSSLSATETGDRLSKSVASGTGEQEDEARDVDARPVAESEAASAGAEVEGADTACLGDDELFDYAAGRIPLHRHARIHAHLDVCTICQTLVVLAAQHWDAEPASVTAVSARVTTFARGNLVSSRYRIDGFIAKSGMGEVYEAFDTLREKRLALKTVLCTASDDPRAVRALTSEVEHALLVSHSNVCRVYELGEHRNSDPDEPPVRFLTMEFVDGETLGKRIRAGSIPVADVRSIALQVLAGLSAAHAKGVLHLDLKSDNVMLRSGTRPPEALIMDFGLSRTRSPTSALHASEQELRGTPGYMAPEQLECTATSRATDIYSFGMVLFEMLTGELPFKADSLGALLVKQMRSRAPLPSQVRPGWSRAVDEFVLRCLHRDPERRYSDAASALAALQGIGVWTHEHPAPKRGRVLGAAGVMVSAILVAVWLVRGRTSETVAIAPVRPVKVARERPPLTSAAPKPVPVVAPKMELEKAPPQPRELVRRATAMPVSKVTKSPAPATGELRTPSAPEMPAWKSVPSGGFWVPEPEPADSRPNRALGPDSKMVERETGEPGSPDQKRPR